MFGHFEYLSQLWLAGRVVSGGDPNVAKGSILNVPSLTFWVTVNVFPVSNGTVQFTGSGERIIICSGDFTRVGSGGLLTTGSSSIQGATWDAAIGAETTLPALWDGGVEAMLDPPPPVASPFTWGSAVTGISNARNLFEVSNESPRSSLSSGRAPARPRRLAHDETLRFIETNFCFVFFFFHLIHESIFFLHYKTYKLFTSMLGMQQAMRR